MNNVLSGNRYKIVRYPSSDNKSLKAWNSADEHVLDYINKNELSLNNIVIYNDRFGYLSSNLLDHSPRIIIESKSQEKSVRSNISRNNLDINKCDFISPLEKVKTPMEFCIIKIPKSMDLFRLYLNHLIENVNDDSIVLCGFMTKYFTTQMLDIAGDYFNDVEQSLAWKKSRLLILSKPKGKKISSIINTIQLNENISIQQYFGVFSGKNIDYATQYLIANMNLLESDKKIMDLASGNGVIAKVINEKRSDLEIHLVDDSFLAIESSKLNLKGDNIHFHYSENLQEFDAKSFDFIVSNPPSHFEHETNIEISINLFKETKRILKNEGHFQLVANKHLNFKTHLIKIFNKVNVTAENNKYIIYDCF